MNHALASAGRYPADGDLTPEQREAHRLPSWTRIDTCTCKHCTSLREEATDLAQRTLDPEYHDNGNALRDATEVWAMRVMDSLSAGGLLGLAALFAWACWRAIQTGAVTRLLAR